jgi:hypothetical protein
MRYFFNLRQPDRVIADDIGMDFETLEEAKAHARIVAAEISRNTKESYTGSLLCMCDPFGRPITAFHLVANEDDHTPNADGPTAREAG